MHGFIVLMLSYTSVVNTCLVIKITQIDANAYLELFVIVVSNLTVSLHLFFHLLCILTSKHHLLIEIIFFCFFSPFLIKKKKERDKNMSITKKYTEKG